jgi:hypothetical protein
MNNPNEIMEFIELFKESVNLAKDLQEIYT